MFFGFEITNILEGKLQAGFLSDAWDKKVLEPNESRKLPLDETDLKRNIKYFNQGIKENQYKISLYSPLNKEEKDFLNKWSPELFEYLKLSLDITNSPEIIEQENETYTEFKFIKKIGGGGYADVWEAIDNLERTVAVKIVRSSSVFISNQDGTNPVSKLVLNHAKMLALVNHPNVVTVHYTAKVIDPLETNNKIVDAIVMEYLNGITLQERLEKALNIDEAGLIGNSIIEGLEAIHKKNIIHNDFHTGNIIISTDKVKIIDLFHDERTFAILTTMTKEQEVNRDINYLKENLRDIINNTPEISPEKLDLFRIKTRNETNISIIKNLFNDCLTMGIMENQENLTTYSDKMKQSDKELLIKIKEILPYNSNTMLYIKNHDFRASFKWEDLKGLDIFKEKAEDPEFMFINHELENLKNELLENTIEFLSELACNSWELETIKNVFKIPDDWSITIPDKYEHVTSKINNLASTIYNIYEKLLKKARIITL